MKVFGNGRWPRFYIRPKARCVGYFLSHWEQRNRTSSGATGPSQVFGQHNAQQFIPQNPLLVSAYSFDGVRHRPSFRIWSKDSRCVPSFVLVGLVFGLFLSFPKELESISGNDCILLWSQKRWCLALCVSRRDEISRNPIPVTRIWSRHWFVIVSIPKFVLWCIFAVVGWMWAFVSSDLLARFFPIRFNSYDISFDFLSIWIRFRSLSSSVPNVNSRQSSLFSSGAVVRRRNASCWRSVMAFTLNGGLVCMLSFFFMLLIPFVSELDRKRRVRIG